ncbi:MAG: hypothetical protein ACI37O_05470, partial [Candidatus Avelusimicrobium sp.]
SIGTQGVVELKGTKPAELTTVALANNTTLGKTDKGKFSLNNITLKQGGNITGGRLFGNTVTVNNASSGKADNLYGNTLTVAGAKTKTLDVKSGASKISGSGDSKGTEEMVWSNEYQEDDACKTGSACAKQYLLKEKRTCDSSGSGACTSSGGTWDNGLCGCVCPSNMVLQDGKCVGGFKPKVIDVGVLVNCNYCISIYRERCGTSGADPNDCYSYVSFHYKDVCNDGCIYTPVGGVTYMETNPNPTVISYEFYVGGAYEPNFFWKNGTRIGGQIVRGGGGKSMPDCAGSDYQTICDNNCTLGAASCSYKCLISKTHETKCRTHNYGGACGPTPINSPGTGKVLTCVKE